MFRPKCDRVPLPQHFETGTCQMFRISFNSRWKRSGYSLAFCIVIRLPRKCVKAPADIVFPFVEVASLGVYSTHLEAECQIYQKKFLAKKLKTLNILWSHRSMQPQAPLHCNPELQSQSLNMVMLDLSFYSKKYELKMLKYLFGSLSSPRLLISN